MLWFLSLCGFYLCVNDNLCGGFVSYIEMKLQFHVGVIVSFVVVGFVCCNPKSFYFGFCDGKSRSTPPSTASNLPQPRVFGFQ